MSIESTIKDIKQLIAESKDPQNDIENIRDVLHELSPQREQPIDRVRWVPIDQVEPNDYNPNSVAKKEMGLLYVSVKQDGYTQPIVTVYDPEKKKYVIVDGFHRYFVGKTKDDISNSINGLLPVTVINKSINDRMASTVRHNRARGEHSISGMGNLVFGMLENGWTDANICNNLGLEAEELLKLKHITGFSALFKNGEYNKSWETPPMIKLRLNAEKEKGNNKDD